MSDRIKKLLEKDIKIDDLAEYERELEEHFDETKPLSPELQRKEIKMLQAAARNTLKTLKKEARITLRLNQGDLDRIKHKASLEGLRYQTYLSSIIHKLAIGALKVS